MWAVTCLLLLDFLTKECEFGLLLVGGSDKGSLILDIKCSNIRG